MIVKKVLDAASAGFPYTKSKLLAMIGRLLKRLKLETRFKNCVPGLMFWHKLRTRNPELRSPHGRGTRDNTNHYFDHLGRILQATGLLEKPHCLWNCDETGIQFQHKPQKVIAAKGTRAVSARTASNRDNITIIASINEAGIAMPPKVVEKGKTQRSVQSFNVGEAPKGTV